MGLKVGWGGFEGGLWWVVVGLRVGCGGFGGGL